jgi:Skp family chaperone for outer membrane proteins
MDKAIKAHPKYVEVQRLQKDYAVLAARADAQRAQNSSDAGLSTTAGAEQAAAKEFDARMGAKQAEVNTRLQAAANQASREMAAELDAYARELDQEYQPKLFSIQLKLKTVQLSKEEAAPLQAEMDKLQQERADKIAVRQRELLAKTDEVMKGKQRDAENELASYAQALNSELAGKLAGQRDAAVNRPPTAGMSGDGAEVEKMAALQRDIASLQDFVLSDIRDKAAKVAVQSGLDAVLAEVKVNVSATDITDAVIAEFKK